MHGRNAQLRRDLFAFLRAIGLQPMEWSQAVKATKVGAPYIGQILDKAFRDAQAVIVLLSPDDSARLNRKFLAKGDAAAESRLTGQPRPNVLFEAGMAFGTHPTSTVLVQVGDIRPISDIAGRHLVRLGNHAESRQELVSRLEIAGCAPDTSGTDWLKIGDFTA